MPIPLDHAGVSLLSLGLLFGWSLLLFIPLFRSFSSYTCQSSMPILHVPSVILSGALWATVAPIALSRGHIHIKGGQGVNCVYLIRK